MKDEDFLDMREFLGEITVDIKETFININFLTPYELKIKSDAIFEDLPLFKEKCGFRSKNWQKRVLEEFEIFNILKEKYKYSVGYPVFDDLKHQTNNDRVWYCKFFVKKGGKPINLIIRLPVRYPNQIPTVGKTKGDYHVSLANKCFGKIKNRWRNDGRYGIAHFCPLIGYYYSLEQKSVKI
ncbi:MAG: hypothetical protein GF329_21280 [Candidatus Lokiarchaeota archaeon]|nr:hypothetical protein [Candidatus Lokiarchaeota archaeon]